MNVLPTSTKLMVQNFEVFDADFQRAEKFLQLIENSSFIY